MIVAPAATLWISAVILEVPARPARKSPSPSIEPAPAATRQKAGTVSSLPHVSVALTDRRTLSRGFTTASSGMTRTVFAGPAVTSTWTTAVAGPAAAWT